MINSRNIRQTGIGRLARSDWAGGKAVPNPEQQAMGLYIGMVMDDQDDQRMGRVWVLIPNFSVQRSGPDMDPSSLPMYGGTVDDRKTGRLQFDQELRSGWILCYPMLPYFGGDDFRVEKGPDNRNSKEGETNAYGVWWQPRNGDYVAVMFAGGDTAKGFWFGCVPKQYRNFSMPGSASVANADLTTEIDPLARADAMVPAMEHRDHALPDQPRFPANTLGTSITDAGLLYDRYRGTGSSSASRESPSYVIGLKSAGWNYTSEQLNKDENGTQWKDKGSSYERHNTTGHQLVMDDSPDHQGIRLRTSYGSQIYFNDTDGSPYIFFNTARGNVWLELVDDGNIHAFTEGSFNLHARRDINLTADNNFNIEVGNNFNMLIHNNARINVEKETHISLQGNTFISNGADVSWTIKGDFKQAVATSYNLKVSDDYRLDVIGNYNLTSGAQIRQKADGEVSMTAGSIYREQASAIFMNSGAGPAPDAPLDPDQVSFPELGEVQRPPTYEEIRRGFGCGEIPTNQSYLSPIVPQHHPWLVRSGTTTGENGSVTAKPVPGCQSRDAAATPDATAPNDFTGSTPVNEPDDNQTLPEVDKAGFIRPTQSSRITSKYGMRLHPVLHVNKMHAGTDFAGKDGDPIYAASDGVVRSAGIQGGYGNYTIIDHDLTTATAYGHQRRMLVTPGQVVKKGEIIGLIGHTGRVTGPHLHFEVIKNGKKVDPVPFLSSHGIPGQNDDVPADGVPADTPPYPETNPPPAIMKGNPYQTANCSEPATYTPVRDLKPEETHPADAFVTSDETIERTKQKETFQAQPYQDKQGNWLIGYGTKLVEGMVVAGTPITKEVLGQLKRAKGVMSTIKVGVGEATDLLKTDFGKIEDFLAEKVSSFLTQNQFDALASMTRSLGAEKMMLGGSGEDRLISDVPAETRIIGRANVDDSAGVVRAAMQYVHVDGAVDCNQTGRRRQDANTYSPPSGATPAAQGDQPIGQYNVPTDVKACIDAAAERYGIDKSIMYNMAAAESGFDPDPPHPKGHAARGLYQFMPTTYAHYNDDKFSITDPCANSDAAARFFKDNINILKKKGIVDPNATDMYMMHFLGSSGGPKFLSNLAANPNGIAANDFGKAAASNPNVFYKKGHVARTYQEIYDNFGKKMSSSNSWYAPTPVASTGRLGIIGDSLAVGLGQQNSGAAISALEGRSSAQVALHPLTGTYDKVIISTGSNDSGDTRAAMRTVRNSVKAKQVVWVLPLDPAKAANVRSVAAEYGDLVQNFTATNDGLHPKNYGDLNEAVNARFSHGQNS